MLEVLRAAAAAAGVEERCDARVDALEPPRKRIALHLALA